MPEKTQSLATTEVYRVIDAVERRLNGRQGELGRAFRQCFPNTLETTTEVLADGTAFVFTGDIPAMWLRDSSAQVRPYVGLAGADPALAAVLRGLIRRQAQYVLIDPYANAFNREPLPGAGHQEDLTEQSPWLWERKFELDSLCYPIQLLHDVWVATRDASLFDLTIYQMLRRVIEVLEVEQHHEARSPYRFQRFNGVTTDTLPFDGRGTPTRYTGMIWSGFRPSDDACQYGYLIPANMFAVVVLGHMADFARRFYQDAYLAARAERLRAEIEDGLRIHGRVEHPRFGRIWAYETDGFGNHNLMDDANVPSLLSIPYLGYAPADDPDYQRTRAFVLSDANPFYASGRHARGVGSPHTPPGHVWPIALIMQALTTADAAEKQALIDMLLATTAGTGYMHESFHPDDPGVYTRAWFAWANSLFGGLVLQVYGRDLE